MAQSDHKTAESSESSEERGMLFVASQESAVITEPGNGALDDPSAAIAAQRPAILSQVLGPTVGAVRRDHFDAQFCEGLIKGVAIITLVSDEAFWLKVSLDEAQGLLDHRGLTDAGCIRRGRPGNSLCINHKLHLGEVSEVLCLGPVYYSSFSSDLPRRGSAPQFPPSRGVMGARSPHSEGISLIC